MPSTLIRFGGLMAFVLLLGVASGWGASGRGHLDNPMLPEGCGSCHVGHGLSNEPMLAEQEEHFCYQCHGTSEKADRMRAAGKLANLADPANVERVFEKQYRHPVEEVGRHRPDEDLPARLAGESAAHAECSDCHSPHQRKLAEGRMGVSGFTAGGARVEEAVHEYEVCLKCHSNESGLIRPEEDLRLLLSATARSSHPVVTPGDNRRSPSILGQAASRQTVKCSDCHGNDDPDGPAGPHGSNYPGLLRNRYETEGENQESLFAYELCYGCHSRGSILGNQSFPLHREHIEGDALRGIPGTSCATCHNPHGSLRNEHLIDFNRDVVGADAFGRLRYESLGTGTGACYLICHNKNHSPARY